MKTHIGALVELCKEQPFSTEKIQDYIFQNNMGREAVTRAALALCDYGASSFRDYRSPHETDPKPEELCTYNWEALFNMLLANGLDAELVICDDDHNYENILDSIQFLDDGDLNARIARNILQNHGSPNIMFKGEPLFCTIDGNLIIDIAMDLYSQKWMLDNVFRFWLVLVGFGGLMVGEKCPVNICHGYSTEIFKNFEKFDYRIIRNPGKEFDMEIFEKETGVVVATV